MIPRPPPLVECKVHLNGRVNLVIVRLVGFETSNCCNGGFIHNGTATRTCQSVKHIMITSKNLILGMIYEADRSPNIFEIQNTMEWPPQFFIQVIIALKLQ